MLPVLAKSVPGPVVMNDKREYAQRAQTSAKHGMTQLVSNTEDPDFGLWTPGSEA